MEELREKYIDMRNKNVINLDFLLRYAIHKGFSGTNEEFFLACNYLIWNNLISQLDIEFNIKAYLETKDGVFIKIIE